MNIFSALSTALGRMGVGRQVVSAFMLVLALTAALGAVALLAMSRMDSRSDALSSKWLHGVGQLSEVRSALVEHRELEVKHSRTADTSYHKEYEEKITAAAKAVTEALDGYKARPSGEEDAKLFGALVKAWDAYQKFTKQVLALGRDKKQQDAADISDGAASMSLDEAQGALAALTKFNFQAADVATKEASATYQQARTVVVALLAVALVVGIGLAMVLTRHLLGQLGGEPATAVRVARAVATGDLTTPIVLRRGDTTSLMASLQAMQHALADTVMQVRMGSESVATASTQIADGNLDLSGRTEQQASALQQTAATMEELGTTVRTNADNARQANQLAQGAASVAVRGGEVVGQVVTTMRGINESSRKISDIISVIDGIAFQTTILALNAAVEAARAGEQGRGFAVVASEVRSLAQRSAQAAREIKTLISSSVERVEQGSALVDRAGHTMEEIVAAIRRVTDIVGEISSASVEQSTGVNQVSEAITRMDQATQQNAALVEQSAAAAESLKQQAQQLVEAVAVFKVA